MIFIILLGLVFIAIVGVTVIAITLTILGARKRSGIATFARLGLCLLPLGCCFLLSVLAFRPADYKSQEDLKEVYSAEFGTFPPTDVSDILARASGIGDSSDKWIKFRASPQTIDNLLLRFVPTDKKTFSQGLPNSSLPKWWTPELDRIELFFTAENWSTHSIESTAVIGLDRAKSIVYFHHRTTD